ncbi:MAG: serine/threonine-protein kinase [Candidatus Omnitrophota bacterium]
MKDQILILSLILIIIALSLTVLLLIYYIHVDKLKQKNTQNATPQKSKRFGSYILFKQIGNGGMANIYLAKKKNEKKPMAVKILKTQKDKDSVKRFLAEGKNIEKINTFYPESPVVKIHEYGRETNTGHYYIAMEYLKGGDLKQLLDTKAHFSLYFKIFIVKEVAKALRDSHKQDIYHRDITPENIIIDKKSKKVTVIDFGIAKEKFSKIHTTTGVIMGKLGYMSPEQILGKKITGKSDIYSLGAVFFHMLEGTPPFNSENPYEIAKRLSSPAPEIKVPVPEELKNFIYKMLEKKPKNRPDASEVIEAMKEFIDRSGELQYKT